MKRYILFMMCAIVGVQVLCAQAMFTCDFEDSLQNKQWVLVSGDVADEIPNKWVVGEAVNNGGKQSLYISADGGKTAAYAQHNSYAICHIDVTLNAGTYDLSFDWQDSTAEYSVELTRADGIAVRSCAFHPTTRTDTQPFPTLVQKSQHLPVRRGNNDASMVERVNIYSSLGQCYSSTLIVGGEGFVTAPAMAGHYIVEFIKSDGCCTTQHLIVY